MERIFLRRFLRRAGVQHTGNLLAWVYPLDNGADGRRRLALRLYYVRLAGGLRVSAKMSHWMFAADNPGAICGGGSKLAHGVACLGLFQPARELAGTDLSAVQHLLVLPLYAVDTVMHLAALRAAAASVEIIFPRGGGIAFP